MAGSHRRWWPYLKYGALIVLAATAVGLNILAMSK
jgi:hypothetical protein